MNEKKRIIVLGAGYGGILTAKKLAKKYKKDDNIEIMVIDKNGYHTMLTELHEVAAGRVPEESIRIDLDKVFYGRKVNLVLDEVVNIDFDNQVLKGVVEDYNYDYLVLGTGSKPTFYGCKGAEEHALTLWSYEDALKIKYHILEAFEKASVAKSPAERADLLTFVVIGCGFTGIEMVGELAEWRNRLCYNFNIPEEEVKLYVLDLLPRVLPNFDDKLIIKTERRLAKMGVEVMTHSNITEVRKDAVCIEGKDCIRTYTTIWAAGVEGSDLVTALDGEKIKKAPRNRIETDPYLRGMGKENVYVVGDNIYYIPDGEERPVPQMVENAEHSAKLVSKNIIAAISKKEQAPYEPVFHGAMVCIGGRYGVAQVGTKNKQFVFSGFIAMLIKHLINMVYFMEVLGFHKVWTYMIHEFFHVKDRRSFVGGHFSKRSPNFWMVPLRLFVGVKWLLEGYEKVLRVIEDPTDIFLLASKIDVSAASEVAEAAETVSEYGEALPVPEFIANIVDWSMNLIFYTQAGEFTAMATVFQTGMVIAEVVVGLALLGGLFTMPASILSVVMCAMIWASGMAPSEILWFGFAGVALIAGSGSTFGLDYYVLPMLKRIWKKLPFVKKWYLFT